MPLSPTTCLTPGYLTQATFFRGLRGSTSTRAEPYLVECKGSHSICSQLHRVQQGHLNEAIGLRATGWPVLITLHLQKDKEGGMHEGV